MNEKDKKEIIYLAMNDIHKEFNKSVNNLLILREFLNDVMNAKDGKDLVYDFPSIIKYQNKKFNSSKIRSKI